MSNPLPLSLTGAPLAAAADPNGTAPGSLTTWTSPPHSGSADDSTAIVYELVDGTSLTVQTWEWIQGTEWAQLGAPVVLSAVHQQSAPVLVPKGGATIYAQVTAAAGAPTTLRAGFTTVQPGAGTASGVTTTTGSFSGFADTVPYGRYNATRPVVSDGSGVPLQEDPSGNLRIAEQYAPGAEDNAAGVIAVMDRPVVGSTYAPLLSTNYGAAATANVKNAAGNLFGVYASNSNAAARWLQVHNTATTPGAGAVPLLSIRVPATGDVQITDALLTRGGLYCSTGIALAMSTTEATYTAATAAESFWHAFYI
jgi:hypothetical protein